MTEISSETSTRAYDPSIAMSSDNTVYVAWVDLEDYNGSGADADIFYKKCVGGVWTSSENLTPESNKNSSLYCGRALDADVNGGIHSCWMDYDDLIGSGTDLDIFYRNTYSRHQLTVTSAPLTGIFFTINGNPKTTPYTEWLLEGSYTLEMPETHNGYVWSHWLEDGDLNRIKTILLQGTTWTAVYEPTPKPVGGKATSINIPMDNPETPTLWIWLTAIILPLVLAVVYVKKRKRNTCMHARV